jgi:CRP-like cAMP-binding protein
VALASKRVAEPAAGFLAALDSEQVRDLRSRGIERRFRKGQALFHEGGAANRVLVLLRGRVKVLTVTETGKDVVLAFRGPGDLLGELAAIDGSPCSATVEAIEPVEALALAEPDFRGFLRAHPDVALLLLETVTRRLRDADRKRVEYGAHDAAGRVAARLVELAETYGETGPDGVRIGLPISQEELAAWTGSSREAVSKALQSLRNAGWVTTRRRSLTLRDVEALRRRSA